MTAGEASISASSRELVTIHAQADSEARRVRVGGSADPLAMGDVRSGLRALIYVGLGIVFATGVVFALVSDRLGNEALDAVAGFEGEGDRTAAGSAGREGKRAEASERSVAIMNAKAGETQTKGSQGAERVEASVVLEQTGATPSARDGQPNAGRVTPKRVEVVAKGPAKPSSREEEIRAVVRRAERAVERGMWSRSGEHNLRMALTQLAILEPGHEAIPRLRAMAEAKLKPVAAQAVRARSWQRALEVYRELVSIRPSNVGFREELVMVATARGRELLAKGRPEEALGIARELENLSNAVVESLELRAEAHRLLGRTQAAIADYERLLALDPQHSKARARLAELR